MISSLQNITHNQNNDNTDYKDQIQYENKVWGY